MKIKILAVTASLFSLPLGFAGSIEFPERTDRGFENVNNMKEYKTYNAPDELVWYEFGRPFWRTPGTTSQTMSDNQTQNNAQDSVKTTNSATERPKMETNLSSIDLDVNFMFDQTTIRDKDKKSLEQLGRLLEKDENARVVIKGHTDSIGSRAYNQKLGLERAEQARAFITSNFDVEASRIDIKSQGELNPIVPNFNEENRMKNRRITFEAMTAEDNQQYSE